ncbi:unnamed protein product [Adineta steineri]|uniref:Uncharacterized protein n=1 Tax=Adineta steineri TaxID=433720 RepID=A0A815TL14_9BILA|nr:unnamed protein product [Adineta steineri]CAF1505268.1 unnamed protein product [Adineta steineri]
MDLQTKINLLINSANDDSDDDEISPYYQQLLNSVKYIDVCFNTEFKLEDCTIWRSTDIIVDKCTGNKTTTGFINQYAQTSKGLTMRIVNEDLYINTLYLFLDKTSTEYQVVNNVKEHFQVHSAALGCVKREDDSAIQLLSNVRNLSNEIDRNFYEDQR